MSLEPLHLISAHPWQRVTFTTYALSLSFFEAVILDALIRGHGRDALILADIHGVRASLSEQGAQRVGKDYEVEPVCVSSGVFHPKISVLTGAEDCHLLVGSGNLTFGGWGGNLEVLEHLHPSFAANAFDDAADFFEFLPLTDRIHFAASARCATVASDLRRAADGKPRNGNIRFFHSLDRSISEQLAQVIDDLGGATRLLAAAPFWDDGAAIDNLCKAIKLDHLYIHAHPYGTVEGTAGANWPMACRSSVHPVCLQIMEDPDARRLHGKAFEIMCKRGRVLVSGSPNGSTAALETGHNIEACVVRIQRERTVSWKFKPSDPPDPQAALEDEAEKGEQKSGVLRAVLDADDVHGEVLTPAMSGVVSVFHVSSIGKEWLAEAKLSADRRFQVSAPTLEEKSWQAGRLVIRVEDRQGRHAEGFVSVASFAEVTRRAGIVGRRLLALLAGTETPADVAAIMSWFHEDPTRLVGIGPDAIGEAGSGHGATEKTVPMILVVDLSDAGTAAAAAAGGGEHHGRKGNWSRFLEHIFAAFRQKRGPFGRASASGKGEDDDDDDGTETPDPETEDPGIQRSLASFEKLLELLLKPPVSSRNALIGLDLAQYICERLQPDAAQAEKWFEDLIRALLDTGVPAERRDQGAATILTLLGINPTPARFRWARSSLQRLHFDLSGNAPPSDGAQGFQSVLKKPISFAELWPKVQLIRTYPEQVRAYLDAVTDGNSSNAYGDLELAAKEEWPALMGALKSKKLSDKILVINDFAEYCPRCNIVLPTGEQGKLRSVGIATAKNCCRRVLIRTGD